MKVSRQNVMLGQIHPEGKGLRYSCLRREIMSEFQSKRAGKYKQKHV
jgi:hypothetical protein